MRRTLGLFALFLVSQMSVLAQEDKWIRFSPTGSGFEIMIPSEPTEKVETRANYTTHMYSSTKGRTVFLISYSDYTTIPEKALEANRDDFNKQMQATLLSSRNVELDGKTGLEFTSEISAANVKSRIFLIGNRLYQIAALVFKDTQDDKNVDRFFQSFAFLKTPQ
jgi:hypothetical protein